MFYSRSNRPSTIPVPCGSGFACVYEERIVDGTLALVKTGVRNVYEHIQVSKDSTKIYNILDRFTKGDVDAINRVKGFYSDVTAMPKSLVELHNFVKSLSTNFDSLPAEVKDTFDNSSYKFMEAVEKGDLTKILSKFVKSDKADSSDHIVKDSQKTKEDK